MSSPTDRSRQGVVLVIVLGMIMIMSWLTIAIVATVRRDLATKTNPIDHSRLRASAYHLLEITIGVLDEIRFFEKALYSPAQGWGDPLQYAGIKSGPLPLPRPTAPEDHGTSARASEEDPSASNLLAELLNLETTTATTHPDSDSANHSQDPITVSIPELIALSLPPGISARITVTDESGKLSLTKTSESRWKLFFEAMGFESSEVSILTDSLLDWMDSDERTRTNGAESEFYRQREPPYESANRPLRDFQELSLIHGFNTLFFDDKGIPNEHFQTFVNCVSLYHTGDPNLNSAPPLVLQTLSEEQGFEWERVDAFLAGEDRIRATADDRILHPRVDVEHIPLDRHGKPLRVDQQARFLKIEILVTDGLNSLTLSALIDLAKPHGNGIYPFQIIKVIENQPLI